jgi:xanthine dehydrogenase accessory factor
VCQHHGRGKLYPVESKIIDDEGLPGLLTSDFFGAWLLAVSLGRGYGRNMKSRVFSDLAAAARSGERVTLGVVTSAKGSSPQKAGALALFHADGRIVGTLGGGCLEAEAQKIAFDALEESHPRNFDIILDGDFRWDDGMICGGRVSGWVLPDAQLAGAEFWEKLATTRVAEHWGVTREFAFVQGESARVTADLLLHHAVVVPPVRLWIAGAGHIAQAVAPLARAVDFEITVFDDRAALASTDFFPPAIELRSGNWTDLLTAAPTPPAFGLIVTRGHEHDAQVLRAWLRQPFAWLGMIGSRRKARMIRENFVHEGMATEERMAEVECPVGVEIGAVSPQEIAVSIVARLIERRAAA